jgi:hypothetical protein
MRCPICDDLLTSRGERKKDLCFECQTIVALTVFEMGEGEEEKDER